MIKTIDIWLAKFEKSLLVFFVTAMCLLVMSEVLVRPFASSGIAGVPGAQKLALGALVWSAFLGASNAFRERRHIVLDFIVRKQNEDEAKRLRTLGAGLTFAVLLGLLFLSFQQFWLELSEWWESDYIMHTMEGLGLPMAWVSAAIPFSLSLMLFRVVLYAGEASVGELDNAQELEGER